MRTKEILLKLVERKLKTDVPQIYRTVTSEVTKFATNISQDWEGACKHLTSKPITDKVKWAHLPQERILWQLL